MALKKSALAVAVTVALSSHAFAAGPGGDADLGFQGSIGKITVGTKTQALSSLNTKRCTGECDEYAPDHDYISVNELRKNDPTSAIKIHDAELKFLDFDLNSYELPNFSSTDSGGTLALENVKAELAIIETNGSTISNTGAGAAIEIKDTTLTGGDIILEAGDTVPEIFKGHKELLVNNGGKIVTDNSDFGDDSPYEGAGNAIDISDSNIDGLIINEDWIASSNSDRKEGFIASANGAAISVRDSKWKGGVVNTESTITGNRAGIELINTSFEGGIVNESKNGGPANIALISGERSAIRVTGGNFKGDIDNSGLLQIGHEFELESSSYELPNEGGILLNETTFIGNIVNNGEISKKEASEGTPHKHAIIAERSEIIGDIINNGLAQGSISIDGTDRVSFIDTEKNTATWSSKSGLGSMKGDLLNKGKIQTDHSYGAVKVEGADLQGQIINEGTIESGSEGIYISGGSYQSGKNNSRKKSSSSTYSSRNGIVNGSILNKNGSVISSTGSGIALSSIKLTGNIENSGIITSEFGKGIMLKSGLESTLKTEQDLTKNSRTDNRTEKTISSTINGNIINQKNGEIITKNQWNEGKNSAIYLEHIDLKGNIVNHGNLTSSGSGIEVVGGHELETHIRQNETVDMRYAYYDGSSKKTLSSSIKGDIINNGNIKSHEHGVFIGDGAELYGNITNNGETRGVVSGISITGGYYDILDYASASQSSNGTVPLQEITPDWSNINKIISTFSGGIANNGNIYSQGVGIDISSLNVNAKIENTGSINGYEAGVSVADDVVGELIINQLAGELSGKTALRMNKVTRTNYTGGNITGNVANHGGTFYVEGDQTIAGDYMQTAGSSLAMGLHKETSLTADNFDLKAGSKVLIDLSKGDLYVRSGDKFELLKVEKNGELTLEDISYEVTGSKLVTIAGTPTVNSDGYLEFEFDRAAIADIIDDKISKGEYKGKTVSNMRALAKAVTGNAALEELVLEKGSSALPDLSGASRAAAMGATNQSNTQVSVRARGLASGDSLENTGLWVQGIVSKGQQDDRDSNAYDVKSHGFVLGADTELDNNAVAGAAYSFIKNEINTQNSRTESDYHMATLYGAQAVDQVLLDGQAYYAWGSNDSSRDIGANASYDSHLYGARVGAGYQFDLDNAARFIPTLSLEASRLSVDGYTESGGITAQKVDKKHFNRLELGLSTELSKDYQLSKAMVTPSITLGAFHDFEAKTQNTTISFTNPDFVSAPVTLSGTKPEKTRYVAGAGVDIVNNGNLTVSAEYNYNWNTDGFDANSGALKFRWDF